MSFELWKENDSSYVKPLWLISLEGNINIIGSHMNSKWSSNKTMLPMTCFWWKRKYNYLFTNQDDFYIGSWSFYKDLILYDNKSAKLWHSKELWWMSTLVNPNVKPKLKQLYLTKLGWPVEGCSMKMNILNVIFTLRRLWH